MFNTLFSPIRLRGLELKNRVVMPAMGTRMASIDGDVTDRLIAYHTARAAGGCGLNIVEVAAVHTPSAPGFFVSISEDEKTEGHRRLTAAIHAVGGKAAIQLWQGSIAAVMDARQRAELLVASDMDFYGMSLKAISHEKIEEVVDCYGKAARRAVEAGYDSIEFHCAHNYLPHSFLSGGINHRTDEYGGSLENRACFPLACIRAIRSAMPDGMPLLMRIGAFDDNLEGGLTIEEVISFCNMAQDAGVDVLDISRGNIITAASVYEVPPIDIPRGFNVENAARIRRETGMITIAVGRINRADQAEAILAENQADLVVMGRAQLADPQFCEKARAGKTEDIVHCVGCNQGCYDGFSDMAHFPHITCMRNPELGRECEGLITPTESPKKVLVAGGGMGGLEASMVLHRRGHHPILCEASARLGGQFVTAGMAPGKEEMRQAALDFARQIESAGIPVRLETPLSKELLEAERPDAVILALGASPIRLDLPGGEKLPVFQAVEVLEGNVHPQGQVCVIGGGLVGLEAADTLAQSGCQVTVLEMKSEIGTDLGTLRKITVMQKMYRLGVQLLTDATCVAISEEGVLVTKDGQEQTIPCGTVVVAVGAQSNSPAEALAWCCEAGITCQVIGDARQPRRALDAMSEAFAAAIAL